jgi:very-short-patch-repair endonuclease
MRFEFMRLHNLTWLKARRRNLRAALTPSEARLWNSLKGGQLAGRKFRRQHSVGHYILDFYCQAEKLAIELDGAAHDSDSAQSSDRIREGFLQGVEIRVLRFENRDVMENLDGLLIEIQRHFTTPRVRSSPPY